MPLARAQLAARSDRSSSSSLATIATTARLLECSSQGPHVHRAIRPWFVLGHASRFVLAGVGLQQLARGSAWCVAATRAAASGRSMPVERSTIKVVGQGSGVPVLIIGGVTVTVLIQCSQLQIDNVRKLNYEKTIRLRKTKRND